MNPSYAIPTERIKPRQAQKGLQVVSGKCTGSQLLVVQNAIRDAGLLVSAAITATAEFEEVPFAYFFKDDIKTANDVAGVFRRMQAALQGQGSLIGLSCDDLYHSCGVGPQSVQASYSAQWHDPSSTRAPVIVLCPFGLKLQRNAIPCTGNPGTISLGWLIIHTLSHIYSISGPDKVIVDSVGESARHVHYDLAGGKDTTMISNAYAHLGSWSYDVGLGGSPDTHCLSSFWRGRFDAKGLGSIDTSLSSK